MKLPALKNSVVVLDEPQSLPLDWWKLVPRLAQLLTEQYDASVIAMTATQPKLFNEATPLVDEPETYFDTTSRVAYTLDHSTERYIADQAKPKSYDAAATELQTPIDSGESVLAICNTIDSARMLTDRVTDRLADSTFVDVSEVYAEILSEFGSAKSIESKELAEKIKEADGTPILHLSTRLRPVDRLTLVETAKALTDDGQSLLTISTQLVEAGVDISFDRVYRDLAPIDSIVQAAGRCNRSFERNQGEVVVWWLDHPEQKDKTPAEAVYNRGTSLLPVAASTFKSIRDQQGSLSETAVARDAVQEYYRRLHEQKDVGKQAWADYVDEAKAKKLAEKSLIDQGPTADILVCRTKSDWNLVEELLEAKNTYKFEAAVSRYLPNCYVCPQRAQRHEQTGVSHARCRRSRVPCRLPCRVTAQPTTCDRHSRTDRSYNVDPHPISDTSRERNAVRTSRSEFSRPGWRRYESRNTGRADSFNPRGDQSGSGRRYDSGQAGPGGDRQPTPQCRRRPRRSRSLWSGAVSGEGVATEGEGETRGPLPVSDRPRTHLKAPKQWGSPVSEFGHDRAVFGTDGQT